MRLLVIVGAAAAILALLIGCTAAAEPMQVTSNSSTTIQCSDCPAIPVERIIDGDTFDTPTARVRLYGVGTPESGEPCYDEATERLGELAGDSVRVEAGPRREDRYGRYLFYTYSLDGESIDEMLIREGLAQAWTGDGQHRDVLIGAEEEAEANPAECADEE